MRPQKQTWIACSCIISLIITHPGTPGRFSDEAELLWDGDPCHVSGLEDL